MPDIYIITGQTATGKTRKALELAQQHDGELINCDARQIYKHLDVVTGKDLDITTGKFNPRRRIDLFDIGYYTIPLPNSSLKNQATKIWLYDIIDPKTSFSAHDYSRVAKDVIADMLSRNKTPIIVGGTYFYLKSLLYNMLTVHVPPNWKLRKQLGKKTITELQELLEAKNPAQFALLNNSDKHNPHRLIRKIEIAEKEPQVNASNENRYEITLKNEYPESHIHIQGIAYKSNNLLREQIDKRVEDRLKKNALEEVQSLLKMGYNTADIGMKAIGYAQSIAYLEKKLSYKQLIEEWTNKEVQYAKRQLTFMKVDPNIEWSEI